MASSTIKRKIVLYSSAFIICIAVIILSVQDLPGIDFSIFYSASWLTLTGQPEMVYDISFHHSVLENVLGRDIPYLLGYFYPPIFLLFIFPFALVPYDYALILWLMLTLAAYIFTIYRIHPDKLILMVALAFPGTFMNILWGQNGFLTTFLLGNGILLIETNPMLSGLMFGLLCYKPQFAFLPLLVLLIGRHWKALLWSAFFAGTSVLASILFFGLRTWEEYLKIIPVSANLVLVGDWENVSGIHTTIYTLMRSITGDYHLSLIIQSLISIMVILIVCFIWRNISSVFMKNIVLSIGLLLTTPYAMQYDLVLLALPLAWYYREIISTESIKGEFTILLLLFLMPLLNVPIHKLTDVQIAPICLILMLVVSLRRIHLRYLPIKDLKFNMLWT